MQKEMFRQKTVKLQYLQKHRKLCTKRNHVIVPSKKSPKHVTKHLFVHYACAGKIESSFFSEHSSPISLWSTDLDFSNPNAPTQWVRIGMVLTLPAHVHIIRVTQTLENECESEHWPNRLQVQSVTTVSTSRFAPWKRLNCVFLSGKSSPKSLNIILTNYVKGYKILAQIWTHTYQDMPISL